jgi:hypothetical protein
MLRGPWVCQSLALLSILLPALAWGQDEGPSGSLTLVSRPTGAAVRIIGDRDITGRTPFTLERGLVGRYQVRSIEPGYETWKRSIVLDGASQDTLWITLRPRTVVKAGLRSAIVPGWGQFYSGRTTMGWVSLAANIAAGSAVLWTHVEYEQSLDELDAATSNAARRLAAQHAEDAYQNRRIAIGVAAGVWAINVLDAVVFFPRLQTRSVSVGLNVRPGLDGEKGVALTARVGF